MSTIEAVGLEKRYGDVVAIEGVSFDVAEGEFFGVLGPNGAGKTTLLEMVEGLREPDSGYATILGQRTWPRNVALLSHMGVQLQSSAFIDRLRVREQLQIFADLYGAPRGRSADVLALVGLTDKAGNYVEELSGGQRQRLSLAFALINDPDALFLDEPTASLDPQGRRALWDLMREINASGTVIMLTTHHIDEAEALCDRVAILDHGHLVAIDTPEALIGALGAPTRIAVAASSLPMAEAQAIPGVEHVVREDYLNVMITHCPAQVLVSLARQGRLDGLHVQPARLEDVFLALTHSGART